MERYFHNELEDIRSKLVLIGEKANEAVSLATKGFLGSDLEQTKQAIALDDAIDDLEVQIDREVVRYITLRGPVSSDVRLLFVAIRASHDIERVGDEAHSIAKKTKNILLREGRIENTVEIEKMSQLSIGMMNDAIASLVEEDLEKARAIIRQDKEVDRIHERNFKTLSAAANGNEDHNANCVEIILVSKSLERIGDHAKNLAEEVIYLLTGES